MVEDEGRGMSSPLVSEDIVEMLVERFEELHTRIFLFYKHGDGSY